jgi:hypothetical protein
MRNWWVNHKQAFRHEFEGRYIWSAAGRKRTSRPYLRRIYQPVVVNLNPVHHMTVDPVRKQLAD